MKQEQEDAVPEPTEVAPGVVRLQLPMAFTGLGHVNTYLLEGPDGVAVVDPGLPGKDTAVVLRQRLAAAGVPMSRICEVVVTHSHPDHYGGAGLLAETAGVPLVVSDRFHTWWDPDEPDFHDDPAAGDSPEDDPFDDGLAIPTPTNRGRTPFGRPTPWGGRTGTPPPLDRLRFELRQIVGSRWFSPPRAGRRVGDGDDVVLAGRRWRALITPGHTADHLCLVDEEHGLLLSGDHVLPTITPHVSGLGAADPLRDYVASLHRVAELDPETLALPAHGHPFGDVPGRAEDIVAHHDQRIERLMELVAADSPATVEELAAGLFGGHGRDPLAVSETYAHLEHLRHDGRITRRRWKDTLLYGVEPAAAAPAPR